MRSLILLSALFVTALATPLAHANRSCVTPRDYNAPLTEQDKKDIRYIVMTLAASNPITVLPHVSALNHAGDRINPVHPLPFLEYIFTTEETKVGIRNLKKQNGKLWREFVDGLCGSIMEERKRGNLTDEMIADFAKKVNIDYNTIQPLIANYRCYDLINILIAKIPRKGNPGRYDM